MGSVESKSKTSLDTVNNRTTAPTQVRKEAGDLIEIFRGNYQHWAIYVGSGDIIHLTVPSEQAHTSSYTAIVKKEKLRDVVGSNRYSINNLLDNKYEPRPDWEILQDAHSRLGHSLLNGKCEHFVTELRYGKAESREVRIEAGDLIEIFRGIIQHWAIYVGSGDIIHLIVPWNNAKAIVKKEKLQAVVGSDRYTVNNLLDNKYKPRPVWEILKDAHSRVDKKLTYSLLSSNCEHFVTDLRYGKAESRQVSQQVKKVGVGLGTVVSVGALISM